MSATRERLVDAVKGAGGPLCIRGAGSKDFYGNPPRGQVLELSEHAGIVAYEPTELFICARGGTPLAEIEAALAQQGQCLACEPPRFSAGSTIGGVVAAGLSGPRRASAGSLRDFVLGVSLLDGRGRELDFGGRVMKNVAGYDLSRLIAGSLGTLGVILEVTLKVLPRPVAQSTRRFALDQGEALRRLNAWAGEPLPIVASAWQDGVLTLGLAGARAAVAAAESKLGGEKLGAGEAAPWDALRDQRLPFFAAELPLWRLSLPATAPCIELPGATLIEWGGAQRWLSSDAPAAAIRAAAAAVGGAATLFRAPAPLREQVEAFAPLPPALLAVQRRLKAAFDPHGLFNPGRLYREL